MRLGDLDALYAEFEKAAWYNNADRDEVAETLLLDAPTIDAVPVVRCKDCKNYREFINRFGVGISRCMLIGADVGNEAFCSYGERKDGDGNG